MRLATVASLVSGAAILAGCAGPAEDAYRPVAPAPHDGGWAAPPPGWTPPPSAWSQPPYQRGRASYYADRLSGHRTAAGEPYDPAAFTAAHRTLPIGTFVDVARHDGRHVIVRINDRGPYAHGRIIDLSRRAASEIGMLRDGVADVVLRVLWVPPPKPQRL